MSFVITGSSRTWGESWKQEETEGVRGHQAGLRLPRQGGTVTKTPEVRHAFAASV